MRPLVVVEVNGFVNGINDLICAAETYSLEEFVLYSVVYPLGLWVVCGFTRFGHADFNAMALKQLDIFGADVLDSTVGVVYEVTPFVISNAFESHLESVYGVCSLKCRTYTPTDDFLCEGIKDKGEEAERVMIGIHPYCNVGDVADPQLVGPGGYQVLDDVGVCGKAVSGVGGAWLAHLLADFQIVSVHDVQKHVTPNGAIPVKGAAVHIPQLYAAYSRILAPDGADIVQCHVLTYSTVQHDGLVMLVIGLLCDAKQCA